jgi:putative hydrolase of HD superfamily
MHNTLDELLTYFKFQNKLKVVLRNNWTKEGRKESSAEHSWSVAMMVWLLTKSIEVEFDIIFDQNRAMKMALIHDIVEIDAGDVAAWDSEGRESVKNKEHQAIEHISTFFTSGSGTELHALWLEHDKLESIESKLVKACDQLCPLIYRLVFDNTYEGTTMTKDKLDSIFIPIVSFSATTKDLYGALSRELESKNFLIA